MATQLAGVPYAALPTAAKAAASLAFPPRLVVIHDTSNGATAQDEALYASKRPLDGATSAHFYVDINGPLGSVPLNKQAWAAYSYANSHGWHVEMCGYNAGMRGAVPPVTIGHTARLVRQLCELADIPMVKLSPADVANGKRGICGHRDITIGLGVGTHDDPGSAFDWPAFIAAVKEDDMPLSDDDVRKIWSFFLGSSGPNTGQALQAAYQNTNKLVAAVPATLSAKLDAILAAALDDGNVDVVLPPNAIQDLEDIKTAIAALPKAVVDEESARLAD